MEDARHYYLAISKGMSTVMKLMALPTHQDSRHMGLEIHHRAGGEGRKLR